MLTDYYGISVSVTGLVSCVGGKEGGHLKFSLVSGFTLFVIPTHFPSHAQEKKKDGYSGRTTE